MTKKTQNKYSTVSLPTPLVEEIKKNIEGTGMHSASAYVTYILRQILSSPKDQEVIDKKTAEDIKTRMKSLGYL
jgi:Arc/MetJ-type ribon-helix-helix transcriptional regulator